MTNDDQTLILNSLPNHLLGFPSLNQKKTSTNDCFPLLGIIQVILCPSLIDLNQPWRFCTIGKIQVPWSALYVITPNDTQVRGDNGETWWAMGTGGGVQQRRDERLKSWPKKTLIDIRRKRIKIKIPSHVGFRIWGQAPITKCSTMTSVHDPGTVCNQTCTEMSDLRTLLAALTVKRGGGIRSPRMEANVFYHACAGFH